MKRNRLLYLALVVTKIIKVLLLLGLVLLVIVFIHWQFNMDNYKSVQVSVKNGSVSIFESKVENTTPVSDLFSNSGKTVYLNDLTPFSIYFTLFQLIASLVLGYFIATEVIRILKSVQEYQPFTASNITSFRRIGFLCLSVAVVNCIRILITKQALSLNFNVNYTLLIFMLITFILAEIFSEGQKLYEQDKLTI